MHWRSMLTRKAIYAKSVFSQIHFWIRGPTQREKIPNVTMINSNHLIQLPNSPQGEPVKINRFPSMYECFARHRWRSTKANGQQIPNVKIVIKIPSNAAPKWVAAPTSNVKRFEFVCIMISSSRKRSCLGKQTDKQNRE